jgi:hypothetical protein
MASAYPDGFDSFANPLGTDALTSPAHATQHADINDAVEAIEATLGLNPEGAYATVAARMVVVDDAADAAAASAVAADASADAALVSQLDAAQSSSDAQEWATKLVDPVSGSDYSAKYNANLAEVSAATATTQANAAALSAASVDATATTAVELRQYGAEGSVIRNLATRVHPAEQLLKQSVLWLDAAHESAGGQEITNLGWGGSVLNAQSGSTTSADSNDPKFLDWDGENYVYLPGVAGNYLSVPDEDALDITGDIDIRVQVAMDDWSTSGYQTFISKWGPNNNAFLFWQQASGYPEFRWSVTGVNSTESTVQCSAPVPASDGSPIWIRVTLDVDNGAAGKTVKFWTSTDGVVWTQLGSTVTTAGTTSIFASNFPVQIGNGGNYTSFATGKFYHAQIFNGINGTPVLDVDCTQVTTGAATSFPALTGQTVTINRSTSGRKSVAVVSPCWLFGTDDYMQVADNALINFGASDSFTLMVIVRQFATVPAFDSFMAKRSITEPKVGYDFSTLNSDPDFYATIDDGPNTNPFLYLGNYGLNSIQMLSVVIDRDTQNMNAYANGVSTGAGVDISGVGDLTTTARLGIGVALDTARGYVDGMELIAVSIFRRALTSGEIETLTTYYQGRNN